MSTPFFSSARFDSLLGNEEVKQALRQMVKRGYVGNSLLFVGPDAIGKSLFALGLAETLICQQDPTGSQQSKIDKGNHPDIHIYRPEGKIGMHSIESMRHFQEEVYMAPYEGKWKFFIIHDAERMLPYSANALLKTFEEPATDSLIILLSSAPESLLSTVRSRCRTVYFKPVAEEALAKWLQKQHRVEETKARQAAWQSQGSVGRALQISLQAQDVSRDLLMKVLVQGKLTSYADLKRIASDLGTHFEKSKQLLEASARESLLKDFPAELTAQQRESLEKEVEGAVTTRFLNEIEGLFSLLLSWYRDSELIRVNGQSKYLVHRDSLAELQRAAKRKEAISIDKVQAAISEAKLGVQRFLPLSSCFESLFLKLGFL